jgi:hypothetical protein
MVYTPLYITIHDLRRTPPSPDNSNKRLAPAPQPTPAPVHPKPARVALAF